MFRLILCIALCSPVLTLAQQLDLYAFYRYNWLILNPASINRPHLGDQDKSLSVHAAYRNQWMGFAEAPQNINVSAEYLPEAQNFKIGAYILNQSAGPISNNSITGNFAYLIPLSSGSYVNQYISIGLNAGLVQYRVNTADVRFDNPEPDLLGAVNFSQLYADFAFGVFYNWINDDEANFNRRITNRLRNIYLGISVPQTFALTISEQSANALSLSRVRQFNIMGGWVYAFPDFNTKIEPSFWLRYISDIDFQSTFPGRAPFSADLNLRAIYDELLWVGGGISTNRFFHAELGTILENRSDYMITLGLAGDFPIRWNSWLGPSIEAVISLSLEP